MRFAVQTLNACFEAPDTFSTRFTWLARVLWRTKSAVVCLQEVTPELLHTLNAANQSTPLYTISPPPPSSGGYFTLILARKDLEATFTRTSFAPHTQMQRDVLVAEFGLRELRDVCVATTHLESLDSHPTRERQMQHIHRVLKSTTRRSTVILTGDFNFCSFANFRRQPAPLQNDSLARCLPDLQDMWPALHNNVQEEPGYTFEDERNLWRYDDVRTFRSRAKYRFDRVLAKFGKGASAEGIRLVYGERIGRVEASGGGEPVPIYTSDHLGIEMVVDVVQEVKSAKRAKVEEEEEEEEVVFVPEEEVKPVAAAVEDLLAEPLPGEEFVSIRLVLPTGARRVQRNFPARATVQSLRKWAETEDPTLVAAGGGGFDLVCAHTGAKFADPAAGLKPLHQTSVRAVRI